MYISRQVEMLLYGYIKGRIPVKLFTDSEPTLESITSSRQVKDKCFEGKVLSYVWLPTKEMIADGLTKEVKMPSSMEVVIKGKGLILCEHL